MDAKLDERWRVFVAVNLPSELIDHIRSEQERLDAQLTPGAVRWTGPEQLHLTLRFLGSAPAGDIPRLKLALAGAARSARSLALALEGLGCFPSPRRAQVIWIGLTGDIDALSRLQVAVDQACSPFGSHEETRAFHPHLTIGRVKERDQAERVGRVLSRAQIGLLGEWTVTRVALVRSQLRPQGSVYTTLAEIELGR